MKIIKVTTKVNAPKEIVLLSGLVFLLGGFMLFIQSIKEVIKHKKLKGIQRRHPTTNWKWDYNWNIKEISHRSKNSIASHIMGFSITSCLLAITYWIGFIDDARFKLPFYGMSLFMFFILMWFYTMISKRLRYGKPYLNFYNFPYKLSQNMKIRFSNLPNKNIVKQVKVTIRFYEEIFIKDSSNQTRLSLDEKYIDFKELSNDIITSNKELVIDFNLPGDLNFNTKLSVKPARFWEVQIECDIEGLDYREYFLLPIYS